MQAEIRADTLPAMWRCQSRGQPPGRPIHSLAPSDTLAPCPAAKQIKLAQLGQNSQSGLPPAPRPLTAAPPPPSSAAEANRPARAALTIVCLYRSACWIKASRASRCCMRRTRLYSS